MKGPDCRLDALTDDGMCVLDSEAQGCDSECLRGNCAEYIEGDGEAKDEQ